MCAKLGKVFFVLLMQLTAESVSHLAAMNMYVFRLMMTLLKSWRSAQV